MSHPADSISREFYQLMSAWADGVLTDAEFSRLDELLKESQAARTAYASYVRLCQLLPELVVPPIDGFNGQDLGAEAQSRGTNQIAAGPVVQRTGYPGFSRGFYGDLHRRFYQYRWAVVASLLVLAIGTFWSLKPQPLDLEVPIVAAARPVEVDSHLAVVTRSENVVWGPESVPAEIGTAIGPVSLRLASGTLELEFGCGASLRLRGPAEFQLLSASRGRLKFGELAANVPERAQGFIIDTPSVEVVDLGTEFGVKVDLAGIADVHVFRGLVETRMAGKDDLPGSLERLTADQTRRFEPNQLKAQVVHFDASKFPSPPDRYLDEPTTEGAICLLRQPPKSVAGGTLESNEFILLFQERKDVLLRRSVPISFSQPGRHDRFRGKSGKLRPSLIVDSYLLHFDSLKKSSREKHLRLDGSVTFPHPIQGVIADGALLTQTDNLFGHPDIVEGTARSRGLDRNTKTGNLDVVTLSEDRRTLHVSFRVGGSSDQLRILIESAKP
jgi:hypothetical protein